MIDANGGARCASDLVDRALRNKRRANFFFSIPLEAANVVSSSNSLTIPIILIIRRRGRKGTRNHRYFPRHNRSDAQLGVCVVLFQLNYIIEDGRILCSLACMAFPVIRGNQTNLEKLILIFISLSIRQVKRHVKMPMTSDDSAVMRMHDTYNPSIQFTCWIFLNYVR